MEMIFDFIGQLLQAPAGKYDVIAKIFIVIGMLRVIFKPLMSLIQSIVDVTPSQSDNELLKKIMDNKAYQVFAYFLDWGASLKLPKKEDPK